MTNIKTMMRECTQHGPFGATLVCAAHDYGNGFATVDVWSRCPSCRAEQRAREVAAAEAERVRLRDIARKATYVPPRFQLAQLGSSKLHVVLREFADSLADHIGAGTGLALIGPTGTGKTYALAAMLLELADRHAEHIAAEAEREALQRGVRNGRAASHGLRYANAEYIGMELRNTFTKGSAETELQVLRDYTTPRLLVLDEVGAASDEHTRKAIATILCVRYENAVPTILAGNLARSELEQYVGARAADRLAESTKFIVATGPSRRRATAVSTANNSARGAA